MTWMDNFMQATVIMSLGMGLVFLFVASLVVLIQVSARILSGCTVDEPATAKAAPSPARPAPAEGAIAAAIAAAMKQYSSSKK